MNRLVPPRGFQTCNKNGRQFGCFLREIFQQLSGQVFGFGCEPEPELSFICFFKRDLKFRTKFRFGSRDLRSAIIGSGACATSSLLRRDSFCSRIAGKCISRFQASERKSARAAYQIDHWPFYLFPTFLQTSTFVTSLIPTFSLYPSPFTLLSYGLDYTG